MDADTNATARIEQEEWDDIRRENARRVTCAVPWCIGRRVDHVDENGAPLADPLHASQEVSCRQGAVNLSSVGSEAPHWAVYFQWEERTDLNGMRAIARELHEFATSLERVAGSWV